MKFQRNNCLLYAITMPHRPGMRPLEEQVREALDAGITMLQLREKYLSEEDFLREALSIRKLTERYHVPLIINDSLYVAINSGADGIHIGQSDLPAREVRAKLGPDKILGVTAKTVAQALPSASPSPFRLSPSEESTLPIFPPWLEPASQELRLYPGFSDSPISGLRSGSCESAFIKTTALSPQYSPSPVRTAEAAQEYKQI